MFIMQTVYTLPACSDVMLAIVAAFIAAIKALQKAGQQLYRISLTYTTDERGGGKIYGWITRLSLC